MADDPLTAALASIRERVAKVTPGPWKAAVDRGLDMDGDGWRLPCVEGPDGDILLSAYVDEASWVTRFAAAARTDVPRLLAAVESLLKPHRRSLNPAWGAGTGNCHGKHFCIQCSIDGVYREWPCQPYQLAMHELVGEGNDGS